MRVALVFGFAATSLTTIVAVLVMGSAASREPVQPVRSLTRPVSQPVSQIVISPTPLRDGQPPIPIPAPAEAAPDAPPLKTPRRWCGEPSANERLVKEASVLANEPGPFRSDTNLNYVLYFTPYKSLAPVAERDITVVNGEATCERAARAYDRQNYTHGEEPDHTAFKPVVVVRLGPLYLVEDNSERKSGIWRVTVFDRDWNAVDEYGRAH